MRRKGKKRTMVVVVDLVGITGNLTAHHHCSTLRVLAQRERERTILRMNSHGGRATEEMNHRRQMDLGYELLRVFHSFSQTGNLGLLLLWHILHLFVSLWYFTLGITHALESYLISNGLLRRYKTMEIRKLRCLAVVIDSEEAHDINKVIELMRWLTDIGVKHICLYDSRGVLKRSKEVIMASLSAAKLTEAGTKTVPLFEQLEFLSFSDGKEAVAKAANLLFTKYYLGGDGKAPTLTESHMAEALKAVGCGGPNPELLLVYGPARCHLGFPSWRIPYTEIVHMGSLKYMRYGSLLKAIHKLTLVRQNYGK